MASPDYSQGAAWQRGSYVPIAQASVPLTDWGFLRSDAAYDVVTVWDGAFFRLDDHIRRFRNSMRALRLDPPESDDEIRSVLAESAEHQDALVLMGEIMLRRGNVEAAAEHARAALAHNANDEGALRLLCEIKSRRSPLLGLWWRWSVFTGALGDRRAFLLLMGMYLAYRIGVLALNDAGFPAASGALSTVWLAFAAYTWVAPAIFRRMLRAELATVRLRPDF